MKLACGVEYDGSKYFGWESHIKKFSIKNKLEYAISKIANEKINIFCAGRTDSGVHALNQVIHFETKFFRNIHSWIFGVNSFLPKDISIIWAKYVSEDFHARYSALSRSYRYIIYNNCIRSSILRNRVNHIFFSLDVDKMNQSSKFLIGENDFSSFRASGCQSSTPWREIKNINIYKYKKKFIIIDITANSFLYHMVRNIVGSLIEIGRLKKKKSWLLDLLKSKDKSLCGPTVLSKGLYLLSVQYAKNFEIKCNKLFFL
ncbi:tRNA pseudouridine(38-40) synthase TruA [Buchnera aphidicola]|uniref:tRNA pseudouridine(38-40) synthase TruA n=1 Tax=Buchnera aphidicola TaxID=9 RepID=UPI0020920284|nr:tRNA pseudouridine(38-40) synthase TruA [Buchnera aphidicola]USS94270.1 tRNA pseudouridine(38-40) synthase TruA [Buchnera aphidicola (Sipha maydis)]WII23820.1 tRNA pseudouridine(38-40) synthase TruA [Buchnera aphidicola (Sipha maydis)]